MSDDPTRFSNPEMPARKKRTELGLNGQALWKRHSGCDYRVILAHGPNAGLFNACITGTHRISSGSRFVRLPILGFDGSVFVFQDNDHLFILVPVVAWQHVVGVVKAAVTADRRSGPYSQYVVAEATAGAADQGELQKGYLTVDPYSVIGPGSEALIAAMSRGTLRHPSERPPGTGYPCSPLSIGMTFFGVVARLASEEFLAVCIFDSGMSKESAGFGGFLESHGAREGSVAELLAAGSTVLQS